MATATRDHPGTRYRWIVFSLLAAAYFLVYFHRLSTAVVAVDLMRDLQASGTLIGLLAAAYFYPYALMQIPAGLLADSWGTRRTVTIFFFLAGIASVVFSLATTAWWAILARVLVGVGVAMLLVPTLKVLTTWFQPTEFATTTGLLMGIGALGALGAATPLAWMSNWLGWRHSFLIIGLVTVILAIGVWIVVRDRPENLGWPPISPVTVTGASNLSTSLSLRTGVKLVLSTPAFWVLAVWYFFSCGTFFTFAGLWGGPYFMHVYGLTKDQSGHILSLAALGTIFGSPFLSVLSNRLGTRKKILVAGGVVNLAMMAVLAFLPGVWPFQYYYGLCILMSFSANAIVVVAFTSVKELFPLNIAGTAVGLVNFFPFLGGAIMQPLVGYVLESLGPAGGPYSAQTYGRAFQLLFFSAIVALMAALMIKETAQRRNKSA